MTEKALTIQKEKKLKNLSWLLCFSHLYKETFTSLVSFIHIQQPHPQKQKHSHYSTFCSVSFICTKVHTQHNISFTQESSLSLSSPMLLRSSISNTMKLLQKTLENIKSCFSPSYQKLPKTPHHNQFQQSSYKDLELEKFYTDFTKQWDSEKGRKRRSKQKSVMSSPRKLKEEENKESLINLNNAKNEMEIKREECEKQKKNKKSLTHQRGKEQDSSLNSKGMSVVAKKLRELEMLEKNNVDYVLDIEEVLHYYSRLTCPLYLEIVDKFFMEMYSELFGDSVRS